MKNLFIYIFLIFFLALGTNGFAQSNCTKNPAGDMTCRDIKNPDVSYTIPSQDTLNTKATVQAHGDKIADLKRQQQTLNNQALQELINVQIANDKTLSAQQATITKSLDALQSHTN